MLIDPIPMDIHNTRGTTNALLVKGKVRSFYFDLLEPKSQTYIVRMKNEQK